VLKQSVILRLEEGYTTLEMPADELRLQYGTAVRPVEAAEEVEAAAVVKTEEAVQATAAGSPTESEPAGAERAGQRRRRRRHRGRRGSRPATTTEREAEGPHS
jgi:hypothetical protein